MNEVKKIHINFITDHFGTSDATIWIALVDTMTEFGMEWEDKTSLYYFHATSNKLNFKIDTD